MTQTETNHLSSLASAKSTVHDIDNATSDHIQPSREERALNPQPLPPQEVEASKNNLLLIQKVNVPGIISLVSIPGFADASIKFAIMDDGSTLIIDFDEKGSVRVAGVYTGPVGTLDTAGNWAFSMGHDRISIYRVIRKVKCYCDNT